MAEKVLIVSVGHSGSSILNIILGRHDRMFSVGEVWSVLEFWETDGCACGVPLRECPFWTDVIQELRRGSDFMPGSSRRENLLRGGALARRKGKVGLGITELMIAFGLKSWIRWYSRISPKAAATVRSTENNLRLLNIAAEKAGEKIIIDSSKNPIRAKLLYLMDGKSTKLIYVKRDGRGAANSWRKAYRMNIVRASLQWMLRDILNRLYLSKCVRKKIVLWTHGLYGNENIIKKSARTLFCDMADALLLYGNKSKHLLEKSGVKTEKMFVIYNSLNYEKQIKTRASFTKGCLRNMRTRMFGNDADNIKILLFVGRMIEVRKLDVVFKALKKLNPFEEKYRLVVIGEGPMRKEYERMAGKIGVSHSVIFKGEIYQEDELALYFLSADLGVYPGSVGLFAVHAHAYGLPVCTHDGSITRQKPEHEIIIDNKTGFFFKENSDDDLVRKIESWFERMTDYVATKEACIEQVEKAYNPKAQADIFYRMLQYRGVRNRRQRV